MANTIVGENNTLYLKSEIYQHYEYDDKINEQNIVQYYMQNKKNKHDHIMFIVPDKSIVCKNNIPENIDTTNEYRIIDNINDLDIIDLRKCVSFNDEDYYRSDTHINDKCSLKITKKIIQLLGFDINVDYIDKYIEISTHKFMGDLTTPLNLKEQCDVLKYEESILKYKNINYEKYANKITIDKIKFRICSSRASKHVINKDCIINKKILIYGDSTTSNKIFEFIAFYFKESFFLWNHLYNYKSLIDDYNPDIFIDIRTERYMNIPENILNFTTKFNDPYEQINVPRELSFEDICKKILYTNSYTFNQILSIIDDENEIMNNLYFFTQLLDFINPSNEQNICTDDLNCKLCKYKIFNDPLYKKYPKLTKIKYILYEHKNIPIEDNFDWKLYVKLKKLENCDSQTATCYSVNFFHVPHDFDWKLYVELNEDLSDKTEVQAFMHYQLYGHNENRVYKI